MYVGILQVELSLPETTSLKDRRRIVSGLTERLRRRFEVAVAQVGPVEDWHEATLGIALVSNEARHARQRADAVVHFLEQQEGVALGDVQIEIL